MSDTRGAGGARALPMPGIACRHAAAGPLPVPSGAGVSVIMAIARSSLSGAADVPVAGVACVGVVAITGDSFSRCRCFRTRRCGFPKKVGSSVRRAAIMVCGANEDCFVCAISFGS